MDVRELSTDQLETELRAVESARRQLAAVEVALIGEVDRRQVPLADGCRTTSEWVAARLDIGRDQARTLDGARRLVTRHRPYGRETERRDDAASFATMQPSLDESWWDMRAGMAGLAGKIVADRLSSRAEQMGPEAGSMWHRQALALEELCGGGDDSGASFEVTGFFDIDAPAPDLAGAELE